MKELDKTDKQILNLLQKNARYTIKEIASRLHLTQTPIYERIKKLEKSGYIDRYITILNAQKIQKKLIIYISVSLNKHTKDITAYFEKQINQIDEVTECYYISGNADYLLKVYCKDMDDYHNFITNKFSVIENINQFYSSFVMAESKRELNFNLK